MPPRGSAIDIQESGTSSSTWGLPKAKLSGWATSFGATVQRAMEETKKKSVEVQKQVESKVQSTLADPHVQVKLLAVQQKGRQLTGSIVNKIAQESPESAYAFCSWCLAHTVHSLVERRVMRRSRYRCNGCQADSLPCINHHMGQSSLTGGSPNAMCGFARGHPDGSENLCFCCSKVVETWDPALLPSLNKQGYCSWCFQQSTHQLVKVHQIGRNRFECQACNRATMSAAPARRRLRQQGPPGLAVMERKCARCSHDIASWGDADSNKDQVATLAWCSWCVSMCYHDTEQRVPLPKMLYRSVHRCRQCLGLTLACRTCKLGMACVGTGASPTAVRCLRCQLGLHRWLLYQKHRDHVLGPSKASDLQCDGQDKDHDVVESEGQEEEAELPQSSSLTHTAKLLQQPSKLRSLAAECGMLRPFLLLLSMDSAARNRLAVSLGFTLVTQPFFGDSAAEAAAILCYKQNGVQDRAVGVQDKMRKMMKRNKAKEDETDDYRNMPHKNINFEPNVSWRCVLERCLAYLQELKRQQEQEQAKRTLPTELIAGPQVADPLEHLKEKWRRQHQEMMQTADDNNQEAVIGGPTECIPDEMPVLEINIQESASDIQDVQVKDLSEVALEEALVKLLSQSQRSSMSCEEQALSDKMLETVFEPGRPGVGLIKDCEVMSSHYEALRYTMDCIVITLKRQGLSSEDKVDPEEVTQMLMGNLATSEKLSREFGGKNPVVQMLVRWTKTGAAFKIAVLGSMLAGPVAAAVASGTAILVGYAYILPKDLSNLFLGSSIDVLIPAVVPILLQKVLLLVQGMCLDDVQVPVPFSSKVAADQ
eukprot:CAMPEP_0114227590 /NCGR_PEP_ID=MMETSP0058-20121206/1872_1 /TAXON_ID=36894 /ORGANISM="Pyramimonas parkeae, CCMP726" /LENGTH=820 /DNA_ID=CAMNT_0001338443 /DNA_START=138 /DNA_END=2601 /DNA_ORIENTATION=-